jgi:hypothetical protein
VCVSVCVYLCVCDTSPPEGNRVCVCVRVRESFKCRTQLVALRDNMQTPVHVM